MFCVLCSGSLGALCQTFRDAKGEVEVDTSLKLSIVVFPKIGIENISTYTQKLGGSGNLNVSVGCLFVYVSPVVYPAVALKMGGWI